MGKPIEWSNYLVIPSKFLPRLRGRITPAYNAGAMLGRLQTPVDIEVGGDEATANNTGESKLRRSLTDAEKRLWFFLRKEALGVKFRRQYAIEGYFADFCCLEKKLVIELDGGQHRENESSDQRRTSILASKGFVVIRFWNDDVLKKTSDVLEKIVSEIKRLSPTSPVLAGRKG